MKNRLNHTKNLINALNNAWDILNDTERKERMDELKRSVTILNEFSKLSAHGERYCEYYLDFADNEISLELRFERN